MNAKYIFKWSAKNRNMSPKTNPKKLNGTNHIE